MDLFALDWSDETMFYTSSVSLWPSSILILYSYVRQYVWLQVITEPLCDYGTTLDWLKIMSAV